MQILVVSLRDSDRHAAMDGRCQVKGLLRLLNMASHLNFDDMSHVILLYRVCVLGLVWLIGLGDSALYSAAFHTNSTPSLSSLKKKTKKPPTPSKLYLWSHVGFNLPIKRFCPKQTGFRTERWRW